MTKPRIHKPHSSRRAPALRDSDYDHEIALVEEDTPAPSPTKKDNAGANEQQQQGPRGPSLDSGGGPSTRVATSEPLVKKQTNRTSSSASSSRRRQLVDENPASPSPVKSPKSERRSTSTDRREPAIHIQQPTPFEGPNPAGPPEPNGAIVDEENIEAIDILLENERGAICCGVPLFAGKALGNLDPPPWTNENHKASATNTKTAQVPDPSWTWAWPEWRVNHDEGTDKDGWRYSFAFHRKFSWHGPKWWNSFVRRRAWIRRRVKKDHVRNVKGASMLQPEYFTVRSSAEMAAAAARSSKELGSRASSRRESIISSRASTASRSAATAAEIAAVGGVKNMEIKDVNTLLAVLRACRIDREKIEAVEKYLENGRDDDLARLDDKMHEVMAFFVFQASRRALVSRLSELRDQAAAKAKATDEGEETGRVATLDAALKHADEEVRRLEYWSDVKGLAENRQPRGDGCGCDGDWEDEDDKGGSREKKGTTATTKE